METYIHTLIAADRQFGPHPSQVVDFLEWIAAEGGLDVTSPTAFQPGFAVRKPSGRVRTGKNPWTGGTIEIPALDHFKCDNPPAILPLIEGAEHYTASVSGDWKHGQEPLALFTPEEEPFDGTYYGSVGCELRATPVSTSSVDCDLAEPSIEKVPSFGDPCDSTGEHRIYSNPWNGDRIEAAGAGCARFWIEFQFGDFLLPKIEETFEIMRPDILEQAERRFGVKFVQGWTFY